jgi:hypothetical protein
LIFSAAAIFILFSLPTAQCSDTLREKSAMRGMCCAKAVLRAAEARDDAIITRTRAPLPFARLISAWLHVFAFASHTPHYAISRHYARLSS